MALCPFAVQRPLARFNTQPRISRYDLFILHTMGGGSLQSTDAQFRQQGYAGLESHFGVGAGGELWQWVDTARTADASLDANPRSISVETADAGGGFPSWTGSDVPAWNPAQLETIIRLGVWVCDTHKIPTSMVPNSDSTSRGIAGHRQGIDSSPPRQPGYRTTGEHWSTALGKVCPGDRRFAQIKSVIVPGIQAGGAEVITPEDRAALAHDFWAYNQSNAPGKLQAWQYLQNGSAALGILTGSDAVGQAKFFAALVAALPPGQGGSAPTADEVATATAVKFAQLLGGTT